MFVSERIANLVVAPVEHCQGVRGGLAPDMDDQIDADIEEHGGATSPALNPVPDICPFLHLERRGGLNKETSGWLRVSDCWARRSQTSSAWLRAHHLASGP